MYAGNFIFSQVMAHLPMHTFRRCVQRYRGHHKVKSFSCLDQFLCLAFAQLTYRESLRDIETCLRAQHHKLYHVGFRGTVSRNTLAHANQTRDWRIYADFAQALIHTARQLYLDEDFGLRKNTILQHRVHHLTYSAHTPEISITLQHNCKTLNVFQNEMKAIPLSGQEFPDIDTLIIKSDEKSRNGYVMNRKQRRIRKAELRRRK